ncbi:MAG: hypothetical protein VCC01_14865, partial [Candidatus Hydrogenedentota bacterium]
RQEEFDEVGSVPREELVDKLKSTLAAAERVIDGLTPEDLLAEQPVQAYSDTGISILLHVVEHFSYHTGQISRDAKALKGVDLGYYEDDDLDESSSITSRFYCSLLVRHYLRDFQSS